MISIKQVWFEQYDKIELKPENRTEYYYSSVRDASGENLFIEVPYLLGRPLFLPVGTQVEIRLIRDDAVYRAIAEVLRHIRGKESGYELKPITKMYRMQRREFFRLEVVLDAWYVPLDGRVVDPDLIMTFPEVKKTKTIDVSGGGAKIICTESFQSGQAMLVKINIPDRDTLCALSYVRRVERKYIDKEVVYHTGLEFRNISQKQQDNIVGFVFKQLTVLRHPK